MQPMWLYILMGRSFEVTFENAQWRKAKQMQTVWLCFLSGRHFEDAFEDTQWRKLNKCKQCNYASSRADTLRTHVKKHGAEKVKNKCNLWDYETFRNGNLRVHLKTHGGERKINAASVTLHPIRLATWGHTWKNTVEKMSNTVLESESFYLISNHYS